MTAADLQARPCPKCGSYPQKTYSALIVASWGCGSWQCEEFHQTDTCRLKQIQRMCQRHNSPAVNTGAQSLAQAVLSVIGEME